MSSVLILFMILSLFYTGKFAYIEAWHSLFACLTSPRTSFYRSQCDLCNIRKAKLAKEYWAGTLPLALTHPKTALSQFKVAITSAEHINEELICFSRILILDGEAGHRQILLAVKSDHRSIGTLIFLLFSFFSFFKNFIIQITLESSTPVRLFPVVSQLNSVNVHHWNHNPTDACFFHHPAPHTSFWVLSSLGFSRPC